MADELIVSARLSSIRLHDEKEEDIDHKNEATETYSKMIKREMELLASAIMATNGNTDHPIFIGFLNRIVASLTEPYGPLESKGGETIHPTLYRSGLLKAMRYIVSNGGWRAVLKKPANIICQIMIKHERYHIGVYDTSWTPQFLLDMLSRSTRICK